MVRTSSTADQTQNDPEGTRNAVTLNVAGEEPGVCTSMIVPVWYLQNKIQVVNDWYWRCWILRVTPLSLINV